MKAYRIAWQSVCRAIFSALTFCAVGDTRRVQGGTGKLVYGCMNRRMLLLLLLCLHLSGCLLADTAPNARIDPATILIGADEQPILRYRYGDVRFKPYVKELFTPSGVNILLDSPPDHVHHRGLMLALGIDGIDFWGESEGCGYQKHVSLQPPRTVKNNLTEAISFTEEINWVRPDSDKTLVKEKRTITAGRTDKGNATLVSWRSVFTLAEGIDAVKFDGRHYFGLGLRFIRAMDAAGTFLNADDAKAQTYRGNEELVRSRWCAYTVSIEGKPVTVAMFDAPKNPRHPAMWFTMKKPFAYLSATLGLHKEPLDLRQGRQLNLRYAVVLWDAEVKPEKIEATYKEWIK